MRSPATLLFHALRLIQLIRAASDAATAKEALTSKAQLSKEQVGFLSGNQTN